MTFFTASKKKTSTAPIAFEHLNDAEFHNMAEKAWDHFESLPNAKQRALLIEWDILNPDGTLRRYPMDHVPLGPRN